MPDEPTPPEDPTSPSDPTPPNPNDLPTGEATAPPPTGPGTGIPDSSTTGDDLLDELPPRPRRLQGVTVRSIDWPTVFPFVTLFRGFRTAIDPSKLLLGLAAILLLYTGGRLLDWIWPDEHRAVPGEIQLYEQSLATGGDFDRAREQVQERLENDLRRAREQVARERSTATAEVSADQISLEDVRDYLVRQRDEQVRLANEARIEAQNAARDRLATTENEEAREEIQAELARAETRHEAAVQGFYREAWQTWAQLSSIRGEGPFVAFYKYEVEQLDRLVSAALRLDFVGEEGVLTALTRLVVIGPRWAFAQHPIYFTLFFLWLLSLLAIFGGAISRVAAVQIARDEKISLRSSLRFSTGKFVSFLSAPLIIPIVVTVVGLAVALIAGLLWLIPYAGEIAVGALLIFGLIAGSIIALSLIGMIGGFHLMYPTIAVEGTDSFDAISRSFSYLYARPWRLGLFSLMALVYGAATFLFVRMFVWLILLATHICVGLLCYREAAGSVEVINAIWPAPRLDRISYDVPWIALNWSQSIAAALVSLWVYLLVGLLGAYAISLYFSLSTIIYYLMRRDVDATELEDVYIDPLDEDFTDMAARQE